MDRATLETAFRRLGGIPALARSEGGAAKIIDIVMAEATTDQKRIEILEREIEQAAIRFEMMHTTLSSLTGAALIGGENCRTPLQPQK